MTREINGVFIKCSDCLGHGLVTTYGGGFDECSSCGGSGTNWMYKSGRVAKYYSGPFLGYEGVLRSVSND